MHNRPDLRFADDEQSNLPTRPEQSNSVKNELLQHLKKSIPHSTPVMYQNTKRHMTRNK